MSLGGRIFRVFISHGERAAIKGGRIGLPSTRTLSDVDAPIIQKNGENETSHINYASLERGVTKYYCNRNPRSLELLGMAEKPRGFATKNQRVDYYHRYEKNYKVRTLAPDTPTLALKG